MKYIVNNFVIFLVFHSFFGIIRKFCLSVLPVFRQKDPVRFPMQRELDGIL